MSEVMPVRAVYCSLIAATMAFAFDDSQRVTVEPPKPPPVMREPITPPSLPSDWAIWTMMSSSSQETSKSSRREEWEAYMREPSASKSLSLRALAASMVR